ncbi:MAG: four helix bundle protein [Paludibacteraceae bacterium]|nr:four helix bundle protein [Paludibacteraceae bacterium]MBN2787759.1 four helix bundle protein [Paludibacteraceae bacterium]
MAKENVIITKTYSFALEIIRITRILLSEQKEFVISKQLLRCGTSIGANAEEATAAISKKEFIMKLQISYKEARETRYWLRLLRDSEILDKSKATYLIEKCEEIIRIINAILQSSKD